MSAAAQFGLLLAVTTVVATEVAPQPHGSIILWSFFTVQLAWAARVCWRRTGLPYATAAMGEGAVVSAMFAILAANGHVFPNISAAYWVVVAIGLAAGPLLLWVESRKNPERWRAWKNYMERVSLWDVVTMRHIPKLRSREGS
jgi:hypothetical protein